MCAVLVVHLASNLQGIRWSPVEANVFLKSNFFVMDKECTMRAPKARSYGAQPLVRARSYGTRPSLYNRASIFASCI